MRTFEERVILKAHQEQTVVLELQVQHPILTSAFAFLTLDRCSKGVDLAVGVVVVSRVLDR